MEIQSWGGKHVRWNWHIRMAHFKNSDGSNMKRGLLDSSRCRKEWSNGCDLREEMGPRKSCGSNFGLEEHAPLWWWGSHWHGSLFVNFAYSIYDWFWTAYPWSLNHCPHTLPGFTTHHKYIFFPFSYLKKSHFLKLKFKNFFFQFYYLNM